MGCMTWQEMFGSGVKIGETITKSLKFYEAGLGIIYFTVCEFLVEIATIPQTHQPTLGSAAYPEQT